MGEGGGRLSIDGKGTVNEAEVFSSTIPVTMSSYHETISGLADVPKQNLAA